MHSIGSNRIEASLVHTQLLLRAARTHTATNCMLSVCPTVYVCVCIRRSARPVPEFERTTIKPTDQPASQQAVLYPLKHDSLRSHNGKATENLRQHCIGLEIRLARFNFATRTT